MTKKILLTASRFPVTLEMSRLLHAAGHDIYSVDTTKWQVCRFSNSVKKSFVVPSPRKDRKQYAKKIIEIVNCEGIDLVIPMFEDVLFLSEFTKYFPPSCRLFCSDIDLLNQLHNKWLFSQMLDELGLSTPETVLLDSQAQMLAHPLPPPYIVKPCYTRAAQNLVIVKEGMSVPKLFEREKKSWIAQKYLVGKKFCSYSVCNQGRVGAHAVYPVRFSIDGHSCLIFESIHHLEIQKWVQDFAKKKSFTGQIAFDFIENDQGLFAIECNPRATSGIHLFYPEDRIDKAFLDKVETVITPAVGQSKQIGAGMGLFGWKLAYREGLMRKYFKSLFSTEDVVLNIKDIKPFLAELFLVPLYLLKSWRQHRSLVTSFTSDYNWDGEFDERHVV